VFSRPAAPQIAHTPIVHAPIAAPLPPRRAVETEQLAELQPAPEAPVRQLAQTPFLSPSPTPSPFATQSPSQRPGVVRTSAQGFVSDVKVIGSQRVDPGTVLSYMKIKTGDRFDRQRLDDSLKSLYGTGYFQDVKLRQEGSVLLVEVKENPVIYRIAFEGNQRIEDNVLAAEVQLKPRLVYTLSRAQADAQRIVDVYRRSGRFSATVEPKLIELEQNRVDLVFEITEGEPTTIDRIVFIGNKEFSDGQLRSVINTAETRWYRFLSSDDVYDPDRLAFDQELLRKYYLRNGYVDFQVLSAVAELQQDKSGFLITFTVEEGARYSVGSVTVESALEDLPAEVLQPLLEIDEGDYYNIEDVDDVAKEIADEVGRYGYAFVDVRPKVERRREEKLVDIVFQVGEGPRVYVDRIDIVGNVRTLDEVIRREMRLAEGDAFSSAKIRESERRIRNLGFFESVKIGNSPTDAPDRTRITVEVVEQSTGELSVGAGVSSDSGLLANLSIRERNLLGRGQDLLLSFGLSFDDQQLDLSFTEPYFLNRPLSAGIDLFAAEQNRDDESNFSQESIGAGLRIGYKLSRNWTQTWGYQLRQDDIQADANASRFILAQDGLSVTSRLSHRLSYDITNNRFQPSEGIRLTMDNALAGLGGDVSYVSTEVKAASYYSVVEDVIFEVSGRAGGIYGLDDDVRLNDRFFLGGTSFRGFAQSGIGARDAATGDALGGNYFYLGTTELTFPLGLPEEVGLKGRIFAEAGALFDVDDKGAGIQDSKDPRVSVGAGVTWASPFGPLRIDFGYAIIDEEFDDREIISFTFGTRF
jgi:outer membrane protein insertion porin family